MLWGDARYATGKRSRGEVWMPTIRCREAGEVASDTHRNNIVRSHFESEKELSIRRLSQDAF